MKGIRATIYHSEGSNCSNRGISSRCQQVTIVGPGIPEEHEVTEEAPAVELAIGHQGHKYLHPYGKPCQTKEHAGPMFGGCFVWNYGSFGEKISRQPVALHDRYETWEEYEMFSN